MSEVLNDARAELKLRQGRGARYDAGSAPAGELDCARLGTAYFARLLNQLSDCELDGPSALHGMSRRHVIAHTGYHARHLGEFIGAARAAAKQKVGGALTLTANVDWEEIESGATLPDRALRNLFSHAAVHLNVEWRDTEDDIWKTSFVDSTGMHIVLRDTPAQRASCLWANAIDLNAGGRIADVPVGLRQSSDESGLRLLLRSSCRISETTRLGATKIAWL